MTRSSLEALPERQRAALLANALPRRTQQLPKRLDPFDCTLCASRVKALAVRSVGPWLRCWSAVPTGTGPAQQRVSVGPREIGILEAHGTYATRLWLSSVVLARWLASHAAAFDGTTVLECGAGTGLCALTLAAVSTAHVIASDHDEAGLALLARSAEAQSLGERLRTCTLDVCGASPLPPADWLVASDVLYTPQLADALARRCLEMLARGGRAIVADPGRPSRRRFQALIERHGMPASFLPPEQVTLDAGTAPRLLLLHVDGERPVSAFPAHADLEG